MLVVTHEMGFARNVSSKTVFMENGVVVEAGSLAGVLSAHPKEERGRVPLPVRRWRRNCFRKIVHTN